MHLDQFVSTVLELSPAYLLGKPFPTLRKAAILYHGRSAKNLVSEPDCSQVWKLHSLD